MANIKDGPVDEIVEDDGLDDLINAELPVKEDETPPDDKVESDEQKKADDEEKPADEETPKADTVDADEPKKDDEQDDESKSKEEPEEPTFKYKGKEYKVSDLETDADLRAKVFTSAEQHTHFQALHEKTQATVAEQARQIEELRAAEVARQQAIQQAQEAESRPVVKPETLTAAYKDSVESLVKDGWIEDDISTLYPNAVAGVVAMRDELMVRVSQLEEALGQVIGGQQVTEAKTVQQTVHGKLNSIFDSLAEEGGIFAPLESPETRQKFLTKVSEELNPEIGQLVSDRNVLRKLWIAANPDALTAQIEAEYQRKLKEAQDQQTEANRRLATGEGGGSQVNGSVPTPDKVIPGQEEGWADL